MANRSKQRIARRRADRQKKNKFWAAAIGLAVIGMSAYIFFINAPPPLSTDLSNVRVGTQVGSFAPDFTLNDINGAPVSLADFRGKPVAVLFFHSW